jgi:D-amino-acid dehydrogenase
MQKYGVNRQVLVRNAILKIEPALTSFASHIVGGTYTGSDESGDARAFTQKLTVLCAARGAEFLYGHDVLALNMSKNTIKWENA